MLEGRERMKVRKIPAVDVRVGMIMVMGTREDYTLHKVNEIWQRPMHDEGHIRLEGKQGSIPFKISEEPYVRIVNEGSEHGDTRENSEREVSQS